MGRKQLPKSVSLFWEFCLIGSMEPCTLWLGGSSDVLWMESVVLFQGEEIAEVFLVPPKEEYQTSQAATASQQPVLPAQVPALPGICWPNMWVWEEIVTGIVIIDYDWCTKWKIHVKHRHDANWLPQCWGSSWLVRQSKQTGLQKGEIIWYANLCLVPGMVMPLSAKEK